MYFLIKQFSVRWLGLVFALDCIGWKRERKNTVVATEFYYSSVDTNMCLFKKKLKRVKF